MVTSFDIFYTIVSFLKEANEDEAGRFQPIGTAVVL